MRPGRLPASGIEVFGLLVMLVGLITIAAFLAGALFHAIEWILSPGAIATLSIAVPSLFAGFMLGSFTMDYLHEREGAESQ